MVSADMGSVENMEPIANAWIGRRWKAIRRTLVVVTVVCFAAAAVLHPAVVARYFSSDGVLEPWSQRMLYAVEMSLVLLAAGALLLRRRWQTSTPRREWIVLGAAALAGSLVISAIAAETGLTVIHRFVKPLGAERHYFFEYDPVLGWKHRPRSLATFKNALVRIDVDGFRVSGLERGPFPSRVLLLGDSQAFGDGVAAEETFGARLESNTPGLRVLNASVIGYGTDQQLLYFEQHGVRHAPQLTLVALNAYDLRDNLSTRVRSGYAKPRFVMSSTGLTLTNVPVPGDGPIDRLQRELQYRSHLFRLIWRMWRSGGREAEADATPRIQRLAHEVYPDEAQFERGFSVTAAILDRLGSSARQAGSRLVVLFLPYELDFGGDDTYARRTESLVRALQQRAAAGAFTVIDGRSGLSGTAADRLFLDSMHLSAEGHQRIAALLGPALAQHNLVSRHAEH